MPTLGELQAAGYHGVHVYCRPCRMIAIRWWSQIKAPPDTDFEALKRRLRCRKCRQRPGAEDLEPYYHDTTHAHGRASPPAKVEQAPEGGKGGG